MYIADYVFLKSHKRFFFRNTNIRITFLVKTEKHKRSDIGYQLKQVNDSIGRKPGKFLIGRYC